MIEYNSYSITSVTQQHAPLATVSETLLVQQGNEVGEAPTPDVKDKMRSLPRERQMTYISLEGRMR